MRKPLNPNRLRLRLFVIAWFSIVAGWCFVSAFGAVDPIGQVLLALVNVACAGHEIEALIISYKEERDRAKAQDIEAIREANLLSKHYALEMAEQEFVRQERYEDAAKCRHLMERLKDVKVVPTETGIRASL